MARRTKDEAEQTRNTILDAAEKVFYKQGVARTSLEQIALAANVTRGAVYWHFRDKIELCEAMMNRVFLPQEDILERLALSDTNTPLNDLRNACCHSLKLIATDHRRRRVLSILMHRCEYVNEMTSMMRRRRACKDHMLERMEQLFLRARKLGMLARHWTPHMAALAVQGLMGGLITSGVEGRKDFDLIKSAPMCVNAFFDSLSVRVVKSARDIK